VNKYLKNLDNASKKNEVSKIREARNLNGKLTFLRGHERIEQIKDLELLNIQTGKLTKISNILL